MTVNRKSPINRLLIPVRALFVSDASAGILLILVAIAAMVTANSIFSSYYNNLFHSEWIFSPIPKLNSLHLWINDGLMVIFFFVVGLEVKREIIVGDLSEPARRKLPMLAAIAGMASPALIFLAIAGTQAPLAQGWAIPAATDIAFAMGVLGLIGNRVPASLRLFLLTVAIVDDIGAVAVIAIAYTPAIKAMWLTYAVIVLAAMVALNRFKVNRLSPFIVLAIILWYCVLHSGVHATIAGVLAAFTIPMRRQDGHSMLETTEHALAPWSAYLIVPVFGFANAGVSLQDLGLSAVLDPLPLAIAAGLVIGKQVGIFASIWLADKIGFAPRPEGASWPQIWGICVLCGIGFTMSLFIAGLAFPQHPILVEEAKIGILLGSVVSALLGFALLRLFGRSSQN